MSAIILNGGRYAYGLTENLVANFAEREGLPTDHIVVFPGSSNPLHCAVLAFTSAQRSYVTAGARRDSDDRGRARCRPFLCLLAEQSYGDFDLSFRY